MDARSINFGSFDNPARRHVQLGDQPFADIAYAVGFATQSHMIAHFKKYLGVTPASLRRDARK